MLVDGWMVGMAKNIKEKILPQAKMRMRFFYILGFLFSFLLFVDVLFSSWKTFCVLFLSLSPNIKRMRKKFFSKFCPKKRCWELTWLSTRSYRFFSFLFGMQNLQCRRRRKRRMFLNPFFKEEKLFFIFFFFRARVIFLLPSDKIL